jgi:hypothetical protein
MKLSQRIGKLAAEIGVSAGARKKRKPERGIQMAVIIVSAA